jgi:ACS family hexuronate transporter-like MFS transporter
MSTSRARWAAATFFALASTWNYLDRSVLSAAGPAIIAEFHLNTTQFGWLQSAFAFSYALAAPLAGWCLDRLGLEAGIVCAVGVWSLAAAFCGWSRSLGQLVAARGLLGAGESAGVPAAGKLNAIYLEPRDRALGAALTQVGIAVGASGAAVLVGWFAEWRSPFFVCALLGLGWIPLWLLVRRAVQPYQAVAPQVSGFRWELWADPRLIRLAVANVLWMVGYVLWSGWTTVYLTRMFPMSAARANRNFAWIPPLVSVMGAFAGGWLSRRAVKRGMGVVEARRSALLVSSIGCMVVAAAPYCATPLLATLVIGASWFWTLAGSVNLYTIPVDIWGGERAGTAIAALVFSYGLLQTAVSPGIGWMVGRYGFEPVCWLAAAPPILGWWILGGVRSTGTEA